MTKMAFKWLQDPSSFDLSSGNGIALALCLALPMLVALYKQTHGGRSNQECDPNIPWAMGCSTPSLGHAVQYKIDPPRFLQACQQAVGEQLSQINLAGQHMIVVGANVELQ